MHDPQQKTHPVHDHARLARARAGQHQPVGAALVGHDGPLGVVQTAGDAPVGVGRDGLFQLGKAAAEPPLFEGACRFVKIIVHQGLGGLDVLLQGLDGVFLHHVHLKAFFVVENLQGPVVGLPVLPFAGQGIGIEPDGHGMAQNGHAVVEPDHLLFVHEQQRLLQQGLPVVLRNLAGQGIVFFEQILQFAKTGFGYRVLAAHAPCFAHQKRQDDAAQLPSQGGAVLQIVPVVGAVFETHAQQVVAHVLNFEAAAAVRFFGGTVMRQRKEQRFQAGREQRRQHGATAAVPGRGDRQRCRRERVARRTGRGRCWFAGVVAGRRMAVRLRVRRRQPAAQRAAQCRQ